ncbi:MAG: 3-hydroxyacyl-CoA dehydrogenase NAD-binding domain-containing protein [Gemmatimonadota bacterium]|nr:3-hydroxyacyl-CoA dehydrogenase NAD-binding domain-containing protein [Gemmatimonadota bacterium]MDH3476914.1 3-hydroxyacyl-CoA dehydrogenase NAD-binding domain-containing protein [Gemmatimonadota bacterium]MDH3568597.1 3-hydroxyacyl-CoA dehydrogenase NAD-binding domain-containing protein [Gemmatimonadota bacterium]MDH5548282.1 3-hydroxyacyl-CoA dehydrogenase NAD-binding domain-containing protein [Gemmatimonadota bacterium]
MTAALTARVERGIAWLELDLPAEPVNKITRGVREEFERVLDRLASDPDVRAGILISRKAGSFIAGADIDEFGGLASRGEAHALVRGGQVLVTRFATLGKPMVAAINGACLGGGLETALACTYRVAADDPKTLIGLPEVQLGILPAAGGCQRLPRLIGVRAALDLILAGKQVPARRAHRIGIVDELVHPAILDRVAEEAAARLASGWQPKRRRAGLGDFALDDNPLGRRLVFSSARKQVLKKTGGHYPAPLAALQAVEHGMKHGMEAGLDVEASLFAELAVSAVSRNLVRIFFATTALKKDPGLPGDTPAPHPVSNLGVVGVGFMGASIGAVAVMKAQADVRFKDRDVPSVGRGLAVAHRLLDEQRERHRLTRFEHRRLSRLLSGGVGWDGLGRADLVIEAVFEDLELKQQVFAELEAQVGERCVLASNTSTIPIAEIAQGLQRPDRMLGMHFFSPVEKMPLLEVIVSEGTAPWATVTAAAFGRKMGKTVIVVRDSPGFWVNRLLAPYLNEAGRLLQEGVAVETIDKTMVKFGFPVGPITLIDEVGLDVALNASKVLHAALGDRLQPTGGLQRMLEDGRFGRKNQRGFFRYEGGKRRDVDMAAYEIIGAHPDPQVPRDDVQPRLVYIMLNEAVRALHEGIVRNTRDGDIGAVFGIGFPAFRGGPLRYLDEVGLPQAVATLETLAQQYGDRFAPCERLVSMARTGEAFHPQ